MSRLPWIAALALAASVACAAQPKPARVLFIGDRLTAEARIPDRLAELVRAMGRDIAVESVASSSSTLEEHWNGGRAREAIRKGWDFVVLQQGPSSQPGEREGLVEYAQRFAGEIRKTGARPALLMVWPPADRARDFPATIESYRAAAKASGAILAPAGEAWMRMLLKDPRTKLYAGATSPSPDGVSLTVLTLYFALFPAGPQDFDEAYVARIARALDLEGEGRDAWFDAATLAIDEPMALQTRRVP